MFGTESERLYELGMAHALGKKVILITKDAIEDAPTDIRYYEFIPYELGKDKEFLGSLDRALRVIFVGRYDDLYATALKIFEEFRALTKSRAKMATKEEFVERIVAAEQHAESLLQSIVLSSGNFCFSGSSRTRMTKR